MKIKFLLLVLITLMFANFTNAVLYFPVADANYTDTQAIAAARTAVTNEVNGVTFSSGTGVFSNTTGYDGLLSTEQKNAFWNATGRVDANQFYWSNAAVRLDANQAAWNNAITRLDANQIVWNYSVTRIDVNQSSWNNAASRLDTNQIPWNYAVTRIDNNQVGWNNAVTRLDNNQVSWNKYKIDLAGTVSANVVEANSIKLPVFIRSANFTVDSNLSGATYVLRGASGNITATYTAFDANSTTTFIDNDSTYNLIIVPPTGKRFILRGEIKAVNETITSTGQCVPITIFDVNTEEAICTSN